VTKKKFLTDYSLLNLEKEDLSKSDYSKLDLSEIDLSDVMKNKYKNKEDLKNKKKSKKAIIEDLLS